MKGTMAILWGAGVLLGVCIWGHEAARAQDDDPLAALAALGNAMSDSAVEGGGSVRAKKDKDATAFNRKKDNRNLEAKVEAVNAGKFPLVAVKLKVMKPASEGTGKEVAKNADLVVVPKLKVVGGEVQLSDPETLVNAGTFFLQEGDRVMVRLGTEKGSVWEAEYIERK